MSIIYYKMNFLFRYFKLHHGRNCTLKFYEEGKERKGLKEGERFIYKYLKTMRIEFNEEQFYYS